MDITQYMQFQAKLLTVLRNKHAYMYHFSRPMFNINFISGKLRQQVAQRDHIAGWNSFDQKLSHPAVRIAGFDKFARNKTNRRAVVNAVQSCVVMRWHLMRLLFPPLWIHSLFAPRPIRSQERIGQQDPGQLAPRNFRSPALLLPGTLVPLSEMAWELSFPGLSFSRVFLSGTFAP